MTNKTQPSSGGIGFLSLLSLLFIGLKLAGYIDWSWWWVTSPLWVPTAIFLAVVTVWLTIALIMDWRKK